MTSLRVPPQLQERLLDVLECDTEVLTIERAIRIARDEIAALETDEGFHALVREAEDQATTLDDYRLTIEHRETDIQAARDRIARDRHVETTTSDSKELVALEHEIASLELRIERLSDEVTDVRAARDALAALHAVTSAARDDFFQSRAMAVEERLATIDAHHRRLGDIAAARAAVVAELPDEFVALYEKQRERYGIGASLLHHGITQASGFALTPGQIQEVRSADPDAVLICPDSNAILIRTAESGL